MTADFPLSEGWDPYQILNVPRKASAEQIKRSYREKVKGCHPDLGPEAGRVDAFKRVTWAYRVLMDARRAEEVGGAAKASAPPPSTAPVEATDRTGKNRRVEEMLTATRDKMAAGSWRDAETVARLAVREDPQDPESYVLLAQTLAAQSSFAEAIGCLTLALHLDPNHEAARQALSALRQRDRAKVVP